MKKLLIFALLFSNYLFADTLNLQKGWNLVGTTSQMSLQEIKTQVGDENLLIIHGNNKTYKNTSQEFLNDFEGFDEGKGYWIKVDQNSSLEFNPAQTINTIKLQTGWNLIDPPKELSLAEIKEQVGDENLLIIHGNNKTYKNTSQEFLNDFEGFEEPYGYWVKVQSDSELSFTDGMTYLLLSSGRDDNSDGIIDENPGKTQYVYDSNGTLLTKYYQSDVENIHNYTYDTNGNLLIENIWTKAYGELYVAYQIITYTHDIDGNILTKSVSWSEEWSGRTNQLYTYTYDTNGNMLTENGDYQSDGIVDYIYTYTYDTNGNKLTENGDYQNDGVVDRIYTYNYDINGNLLTKSFDYDADGTIDDIITYTYDINGNLLTDGTFIYNWIEITELSRVPTATPQTINLDEDTNTTIILTEDTTLNFNLITETTNGTLDEDALNILYTPDANYNGSDSFIFIVHNGTFNSNIAIVNINVAPVNDAPISSPQTVRLVKDANTTIVLRGSDVEDNPLNYIIVTEPTNGILSGTAPNLTYVPDANYDGNDSFTFKVNDGIADSAVAVVSLTNSVYNARMLTNSVDYNGDSEIDYIYTYTYDDINGNILTESYDNNADGTADYIYTYTYDDNDNILTKSYSRGNTVQQIDIYTYDNNGNLLTESYDYDNDGIAERVFTYIYDINDNKLTESYDYDGDGTAEQVYTYTYTYDTNHNMLTKSYDYDNDGIVNSIYTYTYDDTNGNMLTKSYDYNADGLTNSITTYTYDNKANKLTEDLDNNADGVIDYNRYSATYDTKGNILTKSYYKGRVGGGENYISETYTYDIHNNVLTKGYDQEPDGIIDSTITYIYTYDMYGNILTKSEDKYSDGSTDRMNTYTWEIK